MIFTFISDKKRLRLAPVMSDQAGIIEGSMPYTGGTNGTNHEKRMVFPSNLAKNVFLYVTPLFFI